VAGQVAVVAPGTAGVVEAPYQVAAEITPEMVVQVSISPTFYKQLLCQNPFAKKLQTQIVST